MLANSALRASKTTIGRRGVSTVSGSASSFKGVLFGFFAGTSITGFGAYYYLLDQYKTTSNAVVSDVLLLQKSIRDLESQIRELESKSK